MQKIKRIYLLILRKLKIGSALSPLLVKLTGKHEEKIHPKHLIILEENEWYQPWIRKVDNVLDVGCGNGQRAIKIAPFVSKIVGFDISEKNIELAKKEAQKLKVNNTEFLKGDAEKKFDFNDESFDVVFFCDVIEHLNNDVHALSEVFRVLKKNGTLLLIAPNIDTGWKRRQKNAGLFYFSDPDHKREYTKRELEEKLKSAGFLIKSVLPVVYDTPFSGIIDIIGGLSLSLYKKLSLWKLNYAASHPEESIGFRIAAKKI
jgi:ubiquinone/menaquinone biosynthesis C-methylase UbiE